jgi:hypothetical protein
MLLVVDISVRKTVVVVLVLAARLPAARKLDFARPRNASDVASKVKKLLSYNFLHY